MATTARQASSWALAAEVAAALGEDSTVAETHPGGGQYDVLLVVPHSALDGAATAQVSLNRAGRLQVKRPKTKTMSRCTPIGCGTT